VPARLLNNLGGTYISMQGMVISWLREGKEALWSCSGVMKGHWKWEGRVRGSGWLASVFFFCKGRGRSILVLPREGSRFGLSLAKRGCWPRGCVQGG